MPMLKQKNNLEKWIKAIGHEIIDRAKDVGRDTKRVTTVNINATITPDEILNLDITKNYMIDFNYREEIENEKKESKSSQ